MTNEPRDAAPLTDAEIAAIRARRQAIRGKTQFSIAVHHFDADGSPVLDYQGVPEVCNTFIAHAPDDIGTLLAEVERLRAARDECERQFQERVQQNLALEIEVERQRAENEGRKIDLAVVSRDYRNLSAALYSIIDTYPEAHSAVIKRFGKMTDAALGIVAADADDGAEET